MNLSAPFVHRPIATTLLAAGLALFGLLAFMLLPVAPLPRWTFRLSACVPHCPVPIPAPSPVQ